MGIKDNFSQAVKELWKKDGQDNKKEEKPQAAAQPSELDRYLHGNGDEGNTVREPETNGSGVPLETPYYRNANEPAKVAENVAPSQNAQTANKVNQPQNQTEQPPQEPINHNVQNAINASKQAAQSAENENRPKETAANTENVSEQPKNEQPTYNQNIQSVRQNFGQNNQNPQNGADNYGRGYPNQNGYNQGGFAQNAYNQGGYNQNGYNQNNYSGNYGGGYGGFGGNPPSGGGYGGNNPPMGTPAQNPNETDEITVISKNTIIDGNIRSLANMQIDGSIKGNVETTRNIDMSGKVIGDVTCNNAGMTAAAMQGNISLKGRMRMDRDTILIGDLSSQYADINGRIRGKLDVVGKAELKRDAVVFGDINASTIAVTDGAIIQGYVNTTFLSKEDSRNVFPDAISIDNKEVKN